MRWTCNVNRKDRLRDTYFNENPTIIQVTIKIRKINWNGGTYQEEICEFIDKHEIRKYRIEVTRKMGMAKIILLEIERKN